MENRNVQKGMAKAQTPVLKVVQSNMIYVFLAVFFIAACVVSDNFREVSNIVNLFSQSSIIGVLAIGQTIVLITGGFDLSHGSLLALVSVTIAILIPVSVPGAFAAALFLLLALGLANGFFVNKGISPFVVTLGMQGIARTLALWISQENSVNIIWPPISSLAYGTCFGIPWCIIIWIMLTIVCTLLLNRTTIGRYIYAVGGSSESARLSGINVELVRYVAYAASTLCAFMAGMIYVSRLGVGLPDKAVGYEMDSIACAIIGGTSLFGGVGRLRDTFAGVLIYGIITNILNLMGVSSYWQKVVKGLIILVAVYFNTRANQKREVK